MVDKNSIICVIEDNLPIRKLFTTLLKRAGYQYIDFSDGASSLEWLKSHKADALLIDILLPDLNGQDILKIYRNTDEGKNVPAIAITGLGNEYDTEKLKIAGFDGVLQKPINTSTFVTDLISLLNIRHNL